MHPELRQSALWIESVERMDLKWQARTRQGMDWLGCWGSSAYSVVWCAWRNVCLVG